MASNDSKKRANMPKGGPSLNPKGRPRVGDSLAYAMREKFPPSRIVEIAEKLVTDGETGHVRLRALEIIAERGYAKPVEVVDLSVSSDAGENDLIDLSKLTAAELDAARQASEPDDGEPPADA